MAEDVLREFERLLGELSLRLRGRGVEGRADEARFVEWLYEGGIVDIRAEYGNLVALREYGGTMPPSLLKANLGRVKRAVGRLREALRRLGEADGAVLMGPTTPAEVSLSGWLYEWCHADDCHVALSPKRLELEDLLRCADKSLHGWVKRCWEERTIHFAVDRDELGLRVLCWDLLNQHPWLKGRRVTITVRVEEG